MQRHAKRLGEDPPLPSIGHDVSLYLFSSPPINNIIIISVKLTFAVVEQRGRDVGRGLENLRHCGAQWRQWEGGVAARGKWEKPITQGDRAGQSRAALRRGMKPYLPRLDLSLNLTSIASSTSVSTSISIFCALLAALSIRPPATFRTAAPPIAQIESSHTQQTNRLLDRLDGPKRQPERCLALTPKSCPALTPQEAS